MDLIKRYIYAVTKHLPEKQRSDVSRELLSDIEAMVADRAGAKRPTEKHTREVLNSLGNPADFAQQYQEKRRYIIGPGFFDTYITLLKSLLGIILPIVGIITLISNLFAESAYGNLFINVIGAVVEVGVHIFSWVTIIFIILELSGVQGMGKGKAGDILPKTWSPDDLPELPSGKRIPRSETINGIVWSSVALLAVAWQIPALHATIAPHVPLFFSKAYWPYWTLSLLVICVVSLGVEILRHWQGVWNRLTVVSLTIINAMVVVFFSALLLFVHPIVNEQYLNETVKVTGDTDLERIIEVGVIVAVLSIVIIAIWEVIVAWYKYKKT